MTALGEVVLLGVSGTRLAFSVCMQSDPVSHAVGDRRLRLLILDDEDAILLPLSRFFGASGYDVVVTREAEEAEAVLSCETFDVAIIDLSLSGFGPDGLEVLRSIGARLDGLPVVVFSANVRPEVEEECWRLGATAVLTKPQPLEVLARVVARSVGARR